MKLLLDQNIAFRVGKKLKEHFAIIEGVRENGLYNKDDRSIWDFCRQNGFTIITFDEDLYNLTTLYGPPGNNLVANGKFSQLGDCTITSTI